MVLPWAPLAAAVSLVLLCGCPGAQSSCDLKAADWLAIDGPNRTHSAARYWNELSLHAVRKDLPQPTVHARNLFHVSAAMYDAWAAFDATARGVFFTEKQPALASDAAREEAVSYAAHRVLRMRYANAAGGQPPLDCLDEGMRRRGYDPGNSATTGNTPAAIGNRAGQAVLDAGADDGANEAHKYADTTGWVSVNVPLDPTQPGTTMAKPDHWQQLSIPTGFTQNGIPQSPGPQPYIGAHWGLVKPFAMQRSGGALYHDPGPAPTEASDELRNRWVAESMSKQSLLLPDPVVTIDISPGAIGNNSLGSNDGHGRQPNPITGKPYPAQVVAVGDFGRVLAEYWADGPNSETPPGHWNVLANAVADSAGFARQPGGTGAALSLLEWDVKVYLALNGALHDAAITAWEIKRAATTARPISLVRYLAQTDPRGLLLIPGVVEQRSEGVVALEWPFAIGAAAYRTPLLWSPYQKSSFVTPAFPGFISGHSTFSRAAAEVLADLTGSPYFPGGLGEFVAGPGFLKIDVGGAVNGEVRLQWATYADAADQAGQSRIWGGIHIEPDDFAGRRVGRDVGLAAVALARRYFAGAN